MGGAVRKKITAQLEDLGSSCHVPSHPSCLFSSPWKGPWIPLSFRQCHRTSLQAKMDEYPHRDQAPFHLPLLWLLAYFWWSLWTFFQSLCFPFISSQCPWVELNSNFQFESSNWKTYLIQVIWALLFLIALCRVLPVVAGPGSVFSPLPLILSLLYNPWKLIDISCSTIKTHR